MNLKLRTKTGGKLELLSESGQPIEGILSIRLDAKAPDFVPQVSIVMRPVIAIDAQTDRIESDTRQFTDE